MLLYQRCTVTQTSNILTVRVLAGFVHMVVLLAYRRSLAPVPPCVIRCSARIPVYLHSPFVAPSIWCCSFTNLLYRDMCAYVLYNQSHKFNSKLKTSTMSHFNSSYRKTPLLLTKFSVLYFFPKFPKYITYLLYLLVYERDDPRFDSRQGHEIFLFPENRPYRIRGPRSPLFNWYRLLPASKAARAWS